MISFEEFSERLEALNKRIEAACLKCGRSPSEVSILPVTKNHPADAALYAKRAGFKFVGENRVQEALSKIPLCQGVGFELIGHLQTNKAALAAQNFTRIQSADSLKLLTKLESAFAQTARAADGQKLKILLQINAGHDPAKFGAELEEAPALLNFALKECPHLQVEGLMAIAPLSETPIDARPCFKNLRLCAEGLRQTFGTPLKELSMGMTGDLEIAIEEGSTMIRVGTALFGERVYE